MYKLLSNKRVISLFVLPGLLVYLFVFILPIILTTLLSFCEWDMVQPLKFIGLENYQTLFVTEKYFWPAMKNMLILLVAVLAIQIPLALILALLLDKITRGARLLKTAYFVPVLFSATAVGLLWKRVYDYRFGVLNALFSLLGFDYQQLWLSDPSKVMLAVIIPVIWCKLGYYIIIFYAGIKGIPRDYYEAGLLDGCGDFRATLEITLPLLRNVISACVVLGAIGALREYPLIFTMTAGGPYNSSMTLALLMYKYAFQYRYLGYASAIAVILVLVCLLVTALINKIYPTQDIQY